ncbi:MAG: [NiFe]-hydrogenase assembly chaperone HybE [Gammaproteobacteria bacterium]|jgi:[NiFe] hydrogenase assembly HybE family chaperone|nr:[NiFe]-hydrogenase assembly chaperone HybE [Gammaproteobacteria bacterium]
MDPAVDRLVTAYRDLVQPRMRLLPMYNPELKVEAVSFKIHEGRPCGVLLTPWFMNLVLLPAEHDEWSGMAPGENLRVTFPAGDYLCMLSMPEGIPPHLSLPLFNSVEGFVDQDTACRVAEEIMQRLYVQTDDPTQATPVDAELNKSGLKRRLSRRAMLMGLLPPGDDKK